jgi:hypothetical protein
MSKEVIIVLGMHRSYTSLLASWLHQNGVVMFDSPKPVVTDVLYEDPEILALHVDVLKAHGMNWLNARAPFTDPGHHFYNRAKEIWNKKSAQHAFWGWKEPRTCILYQQFWSDLAKEAKVIFMYRDPLEVIESLHQRQITERHAKTFLPGRWLINWWAHRDRYITDPLYLNCWNYYNRCCLNIATKLPTQNFIILKAEELADNEAFLREVICDHWKIPLANTALKELFRSSGNIASQVSLDEFRRDLKDEAKEILNMWERLKSNSSQRLNTVVSAKTE